MKILTGSEIKDFDLCPQFHHNKHIERRITDRYYESAHMGTWAHAQLDPMMRGKAPGKLEIPEDNAKWRALRDACYTWWTKYGTQHPWDIVLATETPHQVQLSNDVAIRGIPDSWVVWSNRLWHVSHKTVDQNKPVSVYVAAKARELHETIYAILGQNLYPDIEYGGSMMNVLRRMSEKRIKEDPYQALHLEFVPLSQEQIDQGVKDIIHIASRMNDEHKYRRRECGGAFLNSKCQYYASCWEGISLDSILYTEHDPNERYGP